MNEFIRPKKDSFPKIRDERYLIEQIKQDYSVLCKMWDITPQKECRRNPIGCDDS